MRNWLRENRGFIGFMLFIGLMRGAVADYNPIPSGSMHPNLLEGDVVLVDRLAFDLKLPLTNVQLARLGEPRRGDVVTFFSPEDDQRLIKRVVGLPGDTLEMRDKRLYLNGEAADYHALVETTDDRWPALLLSEDFGAGGHEIQWLGRTSAVDSFGPITIPPDQYLMLGDNRDNSRDSRFIGWDPLESTCRHASLSIL